MLARRWRNVLVRSSTTRCRRRRKDLAGVAFGLAPLADAAQRRGDAAEATALRDAGDRLRQGVRDLRTLLVEIHPPNLASAGLDAALSDLLSPLEAAGVQICLEVDPQALPSEPGRYGDGDGAAMALIYRVAREAVRNAREHGQAQAVSMVLDCAASGVARLVVHDDGRGFAPADREHAVEAGHVGLRLLEELAA